MLTALASAFTQRKVQPHLAMTGEITLRSKVLPVGGIKEKILAARRADIKDVILCKNNKKRSEEHTSELQSLMRISYAVFCLKKKNKNTTNTHTEDPDTTSTTHT